MNKTEHLNTLHDVRSSLAVIRSLAEAQLLIAGKDERDVFLAMIEHVDRVSKLITTFT